MKKFLVAFVLGSFVMISGAMAAESCSNIPDEGACSDHAGCVWNNGRCEASGVRVATVDWVHRKTESVNTRATEQSDRLDDNRGNVSNNISSVAIGSLASNEQKITANSANLDVLKRDKLVVPGDGGNCEPDRPCGYVTTGTHQNNTTDKIWLKISKCTGSGNNITCE
jgi:hypothetical protein